MADSLLSLRNKLEVLLFSYGEPVSIAVAARILNIQEPQCEDIVRDLQEYLSQNESSGLMILRDDQSIQLVTKPRYEDVYQNIVREEMQQELTPAALETLSLIAYLGPLSRVSIDYIRGINSTFMLRNLLMRGLINKVQGEKGAFPAYAISVDCLRHLGVQSASELPEYATYHDILSRYETQKKLE